MGRAVFCFTNKLPALFGCWSAILKSTFFLSPSPRLPFVVCLRFSLAFSLLFPASLLSLAPFLPALVSGPLPYSRVIRLPTHKSFQCSNPLSSGSARTYSDFYMEKKRMMILLYYTCKSCFVCSQKTIQMTACKSFEHMLALAVFISLTLSLVKLPRDLSCF